MSLLELTAVVAILGLLAAMAVMRFGHDTVADVEAQGFARRIALDCLQARSRAISTGDDHYLQFTLSGSDATQYAIYRSQFGPDPRVDDVHVVPTGVTVTPGTSQVEFDFTGEATTSYSITVSGPNRAWQITVIALTGTTYVDEV